MALEQPPVADASATMVPVEIVAAPAEPRARARRTGTIEITFACGARLCVRVEVSAETLRRWLSCSDDRLAGGHAGVAGGRRHRHARRARQLGGAGSGSRSPTRWRVQGESTFYKNPGLVRAGNKSRSPVLDFPLLARPAPHARAGGHSSRATAIGSAIFWVLKPRNPATPTQIR